MNNVLYLPAWQTGAPPVAPRAYRPWDGWCFQRRDSTRVDLFKIARCKHCESEFMHSRQTIAESSDQALRARGIEADHEPTLSGGRLFTQGPYVCSRCASQWREGKISIA